MKIRPEMSVSYAQKLVTGYPGHLVALWNKPVAHQTLAALVVQKVRVPLRKLRYLRSHCRRQEFLRTRAQNICQPNELRPVFRTVCLLTLRGHFPSHIFESLFWRFVADA